MRRLHVLVVVVALSLVGAAWLALAGPPWASARGTGGPGRAALAMVASDGPAVPPPPRFTAHFLDVGQGDAILVTVDGHRLLVDGGPSRARLRTALGALGVTDIDAILVTNPDADHIRGLLEAFDLFDVEAYYASTSANSTATFAGLQEAAAAEPGLVSVILVRGAGIPLGGLRLAVLHPDTVTGDRNDDSVVVQLTCGAVDVLLMGDSTVVSEASMLAAGLVGDVEVVKAGHHGSTTSSGTAFVAAARPEHVVFSAGRGGQYGHPHAETVARYLAAGAVPIPTDTGPGDDTQVKTSDCATYSFARAEGAP